MSNIINSKLKATKAQVEELFKDLHDLAQQIGHKELTSTLGDLRNRLGEPFMFVVCGEVKAGKSSFINALLDAGREICKVAPQPMTDTIQQIVWGEKDEFISINPHLKRITAPVEILKEIAIVDTPGTNSIIDGHQEVTEKFVPASDLVIFVFECKNPYHKSAWDFFEFIHDEWHKKVVFVLQQKDLMNAADLAVNEAGLKEWAGKKGVENPTVFCVSAKNELEGKYDESGFSQMRDFIRTHVTGGRAASLKIHNNITTSLHILTRIETDLATRRKQFEQDSTFQKDIRQTLDNQEVKSNNQAKQLIENLLAGYDKITRRTGEELENGLSFLSMLRRSVSGIFGKQAPLKDWLGDLATDLETNLNAELKVKLSDGVVDLADSVQNMAKMIELKIKTSKSVATPDSFIFTEISEKRAAVLKDLQQDFSRFLSRSESFTDDKLFPENTVVSPNIAAGGAAAIIGAVLTAVTQVTALDITGGLLTGIGLIFAGITAGVQRKKIVEGFETAIQEGRKNMESALETKLKTYVKTIKNKIGENFLELDAMLETEGEQVTHLENQFNDIEARLKNLDAELV
jgi:GTPase SAR1 family protein